MSGRVLTYVGPKVQVTPDDIDFYEKSGLWAAEEKRDGAWAEVKIGNDGKILSLTSRTGKQFGGDLTAGLIGLQTHLPKSVLVGELEAASEAGTERYKALGYRRVHIFDAPVIAGMDLTAKDYESRRSVVEQFVPGQTEDVRKRILVVKRVTSSFKNFYTSVMADGGEGLVFKKKTSTYKRFDSDGKTEEWVRCKPFNFVDYVVMKVGKSASGASDNLKVGLFFNGKLTECCTIKNTPRGLNLHALVGKVIECKGAEVMKSGALRHGHFVRVRDDKLPEHCTFA
jgi:ATP-dependent DNA ligase